MKPDRSPTAAIGMSASDVIASIVRFHNEISAVTFMSYRVTPGLKARLRFDAPVDVARLERWTAMLARGRVPTWTEVIESYFSSRGIPTILRETLRHDKSGERAFELRRDDLSDRALAEQINWLGPDEALAVSSKVRLDSGRYAHIPMIDCACSRSAENAEVMMAFFASTGQEDGVLLDSGASYHYYGFRLLDEESWREFLGKCVLFEPMIDGRYIGHRLIDGYCRLRINHVTKKPKTPTVIARLG